ncbi:MAG: ABC transporter ATP-binding protein [Deltaproteobacteria bacterium]|nr:ABC transporter ATP-binding protein [Deltaproteobacteria bacterium]
MNSLEIEKLSKVFKGKKGKKVEALVDLNLSVAKGEVFGFLGPNGAGKSTTIKSIMGLIRPACGSILINGKSYEDPASRLSLGYLPENPSFYEFLTGREYLAFVGRAHRMADSELQNGIERVLALLDLKEAADRSIRGYSKGMVQRLGLAQTLLHDPDLYILDEPMSGLDPIGRALVKDIIRDLKNRGKTIFFSTHITADVEAVCDRVGVIVGGRLRVVETVEHIMQSGIEGYYVQVEGFNSAAGVALYQLTKAKNELHEGYVPKEMFNGFMQEVIEVGARVEMIETRRKDLESFFLAIAGQASQ